MLRSFFAQTRSLNLSTKPFQNLLNRLYSTDKDPVDKTPVILQEGIEGHFEAKFPAPHIVQRTLQDIRNANGVGNITKNDRFCLGFFPRRVTWSKIENNPKDKRNLSHSVLHPHQQFDFGEILAAWRNAGWPVEANSTKRQMIITVPAFAQKPDESAAPESTSPSPG